MRPDCIKNYTISKINMFINALSCLGNRHLYLHLTLYILDLGTTSTILLKYYSPEISESLIKE